MFIQLRHPKPHKNHFIHCGTRHIYFEHAILYTAVPQRGTLSGPISAKLEEKKGKSGKKRLMCEKYVLELGQSVLR